MRQQEEIFVVDPGVKAPSADGLNLILDLAKTKVSYHLPAFLGMDTIKQREQKSKIAAIIVLGSSSMVADGFQWQKDLQKWLEEKLPKAIPTLGICYGHQLLGYMHGASVGKYKPGTKLKGLRSVQVLGDERLGINPSQGELMVSHEELVRELPPGFIKLATSPEIDIDAMAHKTLPIWGWQPHIEATDVFCKEINYELKDMSKLEFGQTLLKAFLDYIPKKKH